MFKCFHISCFFAKICLLRFGLLLLDFKQDKCTIDNVLHNYLLFMYVRNIWLNTVKFYKVITLFTLFYDQAQQMAKNMVNFTVK